MSGIVRQGEGAPDRTKQNMIVTWTFVRYEQQIRHFLAGSGGEAHWRHGGGNFVVSRSIALSGVLVYKMVPKYNFRF